MPRPTPRRPLRNTLFSIWRRLWRLFGQPGATHFTLPAGLLVLAVIAYASGFAYLTLERYAAFEARALDLGNLNQAIWNTAHGNWFHLTNQPGTVNRLSLHVEPILLPIALLYRLWPEPPLLLVLQATVVACGAAPMFALARARLESGWAGLVFALVFLLNPSLQAANWLEFHPVTLAPTFLLAALYFLVQNKIKWYALFAVLAASCKEEIGLLVFMLGLYALVVQRRPSVGWVTMVLSLGWSLLAVLVIQNYFAAGNIHWGRYGYLGETPAAMVQSLLTRPVLVWEQLQQAQAGRYLHQLLWPTGYLSLLAPAILLLALPSLALNLLADFAPMHQVYTLIYAAPIVPFVLAAAVGGAARLQRWSAARRPRLARPMQVAVLGVALVPALAAQIQHGYLPGSGNYLPLTVTEHHRRAANITAQIPASAAVSAQDRLNPHVSGRETVYIFPRIEDADMVWLDVTGPAWPQHPNDVRATVDALLAEDFGIVAGEDGYLLLQRGAAEKIPPAAFYSAWQRPDIQPDALPASDAISDGITDVNFNAVFGERLQLLDYTVTTDRYGELVVEMRWQAQQPLQEDLRFYIAYLAPDGTLLHDSEFYQPVSVLWYPTSSWQVGETVAIRTLPWSLETDRFTLMLGVYEGEGWDSGERLPITTLQPALPRLEGNTLLRIGGFARAAEETDGSMWQPIPVEPTPPQFTLDARFGESIRLDGASRPEQGTAGRDLPFTLYWRASQPVSFDYSAFAQLFDAQGNKVAQLDWQPHDSAGQLPVSVWVANRPVVDQQTLALPSDLPPGEYRLHVGLYNWEDGTRLSVEGADAEPGDVVMLGPIRITSP